jgi:hypothetical protein
MDFFWILVAVIAAIALGGAAFAMLQERKRTQAWQEVARQPGFRFLGDQNDVLEKHGYLRVFQTGDSQKMTNAVAIDSPAVRIVIGDFTYSTGSGKNRTTHRQTVCVLQSSVLKVPHFYLRPERWFWDAIGARLGRQDIDFDEDEAFSSAYVLQGDDEAAVRQRFDADVRGWFTERLGGGLHFEALDDTLVFYYGRKRLPPAEAPRQMDQALQIMKLLARPMADGRVRMGTDDVSPGE